MLLFQFFLVRIHILVRSPEHVRHSMILLRIIQSDPGGYDIPVTENFCKLIISGLKTLSIVLLIVYKHCFFIHNNSPL